MVCEARQTFKERGRRQSVDPELQTLPDETEQALFIQNQCVAEEERRLQWMIEQTREDDKLICEWTAKAKKLIQDYQAFGKRESWLVAAEQYAELAHSLKSAKHTIKEVREQRERVQWERKKLNQMKDELSQSSNHSAN